MTACEVGVWWWRAGGSSDYLCPVLPGFVFFTPRGSEGRKIVPFLSLETVWEVHWVSVLGFLFCIVLVCFFVAPSLRAVIASYNRSSWYSPQAIFSIYSSPPEMPLLSKATPLPSAPSIILFKAPSPRTLLWNHRLYFFLLTGCLLVSHGHPDMSSMRTWLVCLVSLQHPLIIYWVPAV